MKESFLEYWYFSSIFNLNLYYKIENERKITNIQIFLFYRGLSFSLSYL